MEDTETVEPTTGPTDDSATPPAKTTPPAAEPARATTDTAAAPPASTDKDETDWKAEARKWEQRAKGNNTKAAQQAADEAKKQLAKDIGKAIGLVEDDTPPDPAQLTEQLTKTQVENRTLKVERALDRAARNHKADEELLLAWLTHKGQLKDLDPSGTDFATQVDELVAAAVKANPKLKADPGPTPPARSGGDFTGGPGEQRPDSKSHSIDDHRNERRKRREVNLKP